MLDAQMRVGQEVPFVFGGGLVIPMNRFARTLVFIAVASTVLALWLMGSPVPLAQSAPAGAIQAAIDAASDGATIAISDGTHYESLTVDKNLTLTGVLSSTTIIQAVSGQRVITVTSPHNLRIDNLTVTGGLPGAGGGGIYMVNGNLKVVNSRITNNSGTYGGGIYSEAASARVDLIGSILELNHAGNHGGALYARGNVALTNTQVLSNTASGHGGGVMIWEGRGDLLGGVFRNNTAGLDGGGLNVNNSISVTGTQFISNTAGQNGGGLHQWNMPPSVSITSARFERNTSAAKGGGMRANGTTTISGTVFLSNTVYGTTSSYVYGGGAHISNTLQIRFSTFTGNKADCTSCGHHYGGGLSIEGSGTSAVIEDSLFEAGSAWEGAGIYRTSPGSGSVIVRRSTFRDNSGGYGSGINTSEAQVENSSFLRNYARDRGGALQAATAALTSTRFISNSVGSGRTGGGIAILGTWGSSLKGTNLLFVENQGYDADGTADIFFSGGVSGNLRHLTIAHPSMSASPAIRMGSMSTLNIRNSIIVSHTVGISQTNGTVDVDYTLFFGGASIQSSGADLITGTRILTAQNPRFVNAAAGDYHLMIGSPAIDYGFNLGVTTDLDGAPRPIGANPDLGAYETLSAPDVYLPFVRRN